jgi:hypothetical protein
MAGIIAASPARIIAMINPNAPVLMNHPAYLLLALYLLFATTSESLRADDFDTAIRPLLASYCVSCHAGDDPSGELDLEMILTTQEVDEHFETWGKAVELVQTNKMPPADELQPTPDERELLRDWYQTRFERNIQAKPGPFRPRRLAAVEYRNTLRSLFGFDLEIAVIEAEQTRTEKSLVLKILQEDAPGMSGFRNDTHAAPLTTVLWDQYSMLADRALEEFFSPARLGIATGDFDAAKAESVIREFVPRAFRRSLPDQTIDKMLENIRSSMHPLEATKMELKVVLMSPQFLYRGLLIEADVGQQLVDDFELAERLSYFLWADMPDAELLDMAKSGRLGQIAELQTQVVRMLDSPKSLSLTTDFAAQWLSLDEID